MFLGYQARRGLGADFYCVKKFERGISTVGGGRSYIPITEPTKEILRNSS